MPNYEFQCESCHVKFEELTAYDESGKYPDIKCPKCNSDKKQKLMSCCSFAFTNPVDTDRWNNSHDYRFRHNLPKVLKERQDAEMAAATNPYSNIDDLHLDTGIHDPETRKGLS